MNPEDVGLVVSIGLAIVASIAALFIIAFVIYPRRHPRGQSTFNYTPRGDRVIVKRLPRPEPEEGEMFTPDSQQKPLDEGEVIAVGAVPDIHVGDHVCFLEYAGTTIEIDGQQYLSMRECEVHGVRI